MAYDARSPAEQLQAITGRGPRASDGSIWSSRRAAAMSVFMVAAIGEGDDSPDAPTRAATARPSTGDG
jgi:hypothetical protein